MIQPIDSLSPATFSCLPLLYSFYFWLKSMTEGIFTVSSWADWVVAQSFSAQLNMVKVESFFLFHSQESMAGHIIPL